MLLTLNYSIILNICFEFLSLLATLQSKNREAALFPFQLETHCGVIEEYKVTICANFSLLHCTLQNLFHAGFVKTSYENMKSPRKNSRTPILIKR